MHQAKFTDPPALIARSHVRSYDKSQGREILRFLFVALITLSSPSYALAGLLLEFSPLRAAIGEADVRAEWALSNSISAGLGLSRLSRATGEVSEPANTENRYDATLLYYPRVAGSEGFFVGAKVSMVNFERNFRAPLPTRTYSEFRSDPDMAWRSEISRVAGGGHLGWRVWLGRFASGAVSVDFLSTLSEQVRVLEIDAVYDGIDPTRRVPERFERRIMLHFGLAIP